MSDPTRSFTKPSIALGFFAALFTLVSAQDDYPRREAVEFHARGGIPHVLATIKEGGGREIRVAYLGGSITAAPGWRVKSLALLREKHPELIWTEINAAIGGTGSDLGVFRFDQDVLRHRPDLLFVEFAVNDGGAQPQQIHQAMEGIVRQAWKANPETDIIFVYTISEPFLADLQSGKFSRAASAMEEVADHYGIPSIHLGIEVAKRAKEGSLIFKQEKPADGAAILFSNDGVHPLMTGHVLYTEAVARAWEQLATVREDPSASPRLSGAPLRPDHWEAAKLVPLTREMLSGEWTLLDGGKSGDEIAKRFNRLMPQMWRTATTGASLTFRFKGSVMGFYDLVGPDGGHLKVTLDGGNERIVPRFDAYCTYHRLSKIQIGSGLDPSALHTVTATLDASAPDKRKILFEKNRPDMDKNPEKYTPNQWHVGSVMLIGETVE
ncbi:MAG: SGNH/GDSL hydrolase family protein [Akkermansiaceae bacterium]